MLVEKRKAYLHKTLGDDMHRICLQRAVFTAIGETLDCKSVSIAARLGRGEAHHALAQALANR